MPGESKEPGMPEQETTQRAERYDRCVVIGRRVSIAFKPVVAALLETAAFSGSIANYDERKKDFLDLLDAIEKMQPGDVEHALLNNLLRKLSWIDALPKRLHYTYIKQFVSACRTFIDKLNIPSAEFYANRGAGSQVKSLEHIYEFFSALEKI